MIEFVSKKLASGKRVHELELLKRMLAYHKGFLNIWKQSLSEIYGIQLREKSVENVVNVLTNEFPTGAGKKTYSECVFLKRSEESGEYRVSDSFGKMLNNPDFMGF